MINARDVAKVYGTTISYVYKLASLRKWRRLRHNGETYYHIEDVDKTLGK
jgi:hypothetical protein